MSRKKATLYGIGAFGQIIKVEGTLGDHGRNPETCMAYNYRGFGDAPWVAMHRPRCRRADYYWRDWAPSRYLLVLAGWGHPDPPIFPNTANANRDASLLHGFNEDITAYTVMNGVDILVDYRDVVADPTLTERYHREVEERRSERCAPSQQRLPPFPRY